MAFSPSNVILYDIDELYEYVNFTKSITYEDPELPGETWNISISPDSPNPSSVSITGGAVGKIFGYFSNAFDPYSVKYLKKPKKKKTKLKDYSIVSDWNDVSNAKEIVSYQPSLIQSRTYTYTVTAVSSVTNISVSLVYSIVVTNNWTAGRDRLKAAIAQTKVRA